MSAMKAMLDRLGTCLGQVSLTPPFRGVGERGLEIPTVLTVFPGRGWRGEKPLKRFEVSTGSRATLLKQGVNENGGKKGNIGGNVDFILGLCDFVVNQ
jgi:hypothetical protein